MVWWKKKAPDADPTAICNMLVKLAWVTREQVNAALVTKGKRKIGETLVDMGILHPSQLEAVLLSQSAARGKMPMRKAASAQLEANQSLQEKVVTGFAEITALGRSVTSKYATIKRSK